MTRPSYFYENISDFLGRGQTISGSGYPTLEWSSGIKKLCNILLEFFESPQYKEFKNKEIFFLNSKPDTKNEQLIISPIVSIIIESLVNVGRVIEGSNSIFMIHLHDILWPIFERHTHATGLNPLQQHLTIRIIAVLNAHLNEGLNLPIVKALLLGLEPIDYIRNLHPQSPLFLFSANCYTNLKPLKTLYHKKGGDITEYLPHDVTYDFNKNTLFRTYLDSTVKEVNLNEVDFKEIDLFDKKNWQI